MTILDVDIRRPLSAASVHVARAKAVRRRCVCLAAVAGFTALFIASPFTGLHSAVTLVLLFALVLVALFNLETNLRMYLPVSDVDSEVLEQACTATAEGRAYKEAVDEQGRPFVYAEYWALRDHAAFVQALQGARINQLPK